MFKNKTVILFTFFIFTTIFSCKPQEKKIDSTTTEQNNVFLKMQRTPCYGKCPNYVVEISSSGQVSYLGKMFVDYIGQYESTLSITDLDFLKAKVTEINFFDFSDIYDNSATDIPSTIFEVSMNKRYKKVVNRHNGPAELKELEKLVEDIIYNSKLNKVQE